MVVTKTMAGAGAEPGELPTLAVPRSPSIHPALLQQSLKQVGASKGAGVGIGEGDAAVEIAHQHRRPGAPGLRQGQ